MQEPWTILKVLDWTTSRFERAGFDSPRLDAQVLLTHVLQCQRVDLYTRYDQPLEGDELGQYRELIEMRLRGKPVAYLVGHKEFWSLTLQVDSRVLIPRPDTETLVQVGLELGAADEQLDVFEVATGSGAVVIALARERSKWRLFASDKSEQAIEVAKGNAERCGVSARVEFGVGHLLEPALGGSFHLIVSNLPYLAASEMDEVAKEVHFEPRLALVSGPTGYELLNELIADAPRSLHDEGWLALEHGFDQGAKVRASLESSGFHSVETRDDLGGRARVSFGQWKRP